MTIGHLICRFTYVNIHVLPPMAERQEETTGKKESTTDDRRTFNRRSMLKLAGVAVAGAGLTRTLGSVSAATTVNLGDKGLSEGDEIDPYLNDYFVDDTEAVVPAGEYVWNGDGLGGNYRDAALVGDGDVVLRHPDGMHRAPTTHATGGTVAVKNITIRGLCDGNDSRWRLQADDGAAIVLENFAFPDGMEGDFGDATGIYVPPSHAGELTLRDVHLEDFSNNGLYASAPGKPDGGEQGPVYVEGGLYKNNNVAGVRLGSNNSHAIGVTVVNDALSPDIGGPGTVQRGIRIREPGDDITIENCDVYHSWDGSASPIQLHPEADGATGVIRDTRVYNNSGSTAVTSGAADGFTADGLSITGDGDLSYPSNFTDVCVGDGCPTADPDPGSTTDSTDDTTTSTDDTTTSTDDGSTDGRLFVVEATDDAPKFSYQFTTTGAVTKVEDGSTLSAEGNDTITANDDGTYTVEGVTGSGYGDSFRVEGEFAGFSADTGEEHYTLLLEGDEVTKDSLGSDGEPASTRLEIVAVENGPKFTYEFVTDGELSKVKDGSRLKAEGNDSITDNGDGTYTVVGETGNGYGDSFDLTGEVTSFTADTAESNFVLRYGGEEVTVDDLVADQSLPNEISFDGMGTEETATYRFEVSGEVAAGSGGSVEDADTVSGAVVEGSVTADTDVYGFSGDLIDFSLSGAARVGIEVTE